MTTAALPDRLARPHGREALAHFWREHARVRAVVLDHLRAANPAREPGELLPTAQRVVDRALFLHLGERRGMITADSRDRVAAEAWPSETLVVPEDARAAAQELARLDCGVELDVTVLGRCFERWVAEREPARPERAEAPRGRQRRQRQREGVFYTPPHITRYMVQAALGGWLARQRDALGLGGRSTPGGRRAGGRRQKPGAWLAYREVLASVRVLDLACGAGAFLVTALALLRAEAGRVEAALRRLRGGQLDWLDRGGPLGLTGALYGVDLDAEAVGFCRRALWLEAGRADLPLGALEATVRVGDSLVADPALSGRAFPWDGRFADRFDVIVGNPPYDVLAERETGATDLAGRRRYFREHPALRHAFGGKLNLYKLFLCQMIDRLAPGGVLAAICPMALMGDQQARGVRRLLFERCSVVSVDAFPQKDDPERRVFEDAKLSTCVLVARQGAGDEPFGVRVHPADRIEREWSDALSITPSRLRRLDEENLPVPGCTGADWDVVERVLDHPGFARLGASVKSYQGEVNETAVRRRGAILTRDSSRPPVLRGANLTLYAVREASQGETFFIDDAELLRGARPDAKVHHAGARRIGFQRSSPQNNFRRIIAAPIAPGRYCFDTVSYVTAASSAVDLDALLALLNSRLYDYWFRLTSSNSKVNEYQFDNLPWLRLAPDREAPEVSERVADDRWPDLVRTLEARVSTGLAPTWAEQVLAVLARDLAAAESARVLTSRSERSRLGEAGARLQRRVDQVVYALFGLGPTQRAHVERRLEEML